MDKVYGRTCSIFNIIDSNKHAVALNEILGGKIKNVVVESKDIASQLLQAMKGKDPERITF